MKRKVLSLLIVAAVALGSGCSLFGGGGGGGGGGGSKPPSIDGHKASFLFDNAKTRVMNILSPKLSYDAFKGVVQRCKNNGDNMVYLYLMNEKDGPWTPYSFYSGNDIGGNVNQSAVDDYTKRIEYVRSQGLGIVFWLRADDSPNYVKVMARAADGKEEETWVYSPSWAEGAPVARSTGETFNIKSVSKQKKYQSDAVGFFDKYASAWIVGLEANEYYSAGTINDYAAHLQGITSKPIGVHLTGGHYAEAKGGSIDSLWFQYGFGQSTSKIKSMTKDVIGKMGGKPVYATEYNMSSDSSTAKAQGDAAMQGGAKGTGNGRN